MGGLPDRVWQEIRRKIHANPNSDKRKNSHVLSQLRAVRIESKSLTFCLNGIEKTKSLCSLPTSLGKKIATDFDRE